MFLLHLLPLLFKHVGVILGNIRGDGRRHDDTKAKVESFLFHLYIVDLDTIMEFLDKFNRILNKLNRTSGAQS